MESRMLYNHPSMCRLHHARFHGGKLLNLESNLQKSPKSITTFTGQEVVWISFFGIDEVGDGRSDFYTILT